MVKSGRLEAVVDATYPLERAPEALARLENRDVFGKLVIVP
jgi:NADPH:quinone reductase-like Zn-dependent oxidoreductase